MLPLSARERLADFSHTESPSAHYEDIPAKRKPPKNTLPHTTHTAPKYHCEALCSRAALHDKTHPTPLAKASQEGTHTPSS